MVIDAVRQEDFLIITVNGRIGGESSVEFYRKVKELISDSPDNSVIIDFNKVDFIDSSGLGSLVAINSHLIKSEKNLVLAALPDNLLSLLKMTNLTSILNIVKKAEDAISSK